MVAKRRLSIVVKMSSNYSANQYDKAFNSIYLQNWTIPKQYKEKPSQAEGHTLFIATDRGHLLPGVKRGFPWPSFQGTWDVPCHIPPLHINPTARSQEGQQRLMAWGQMQRLVPSASGELKETRGTSDGHQHKSCSVSPPVPVGPKLERTTSPDIQVQSRPATQQSQVESRPVTQQSQVESRPVSQQSQVESRPVSQQSQVQSRPVTQQSQVQSGPVTEQNEAQSRPATKQSLVQAGPGGEQSLVLCRPLSHQGQVQCRLSRQKSHAKSQNLC